MQYLAAMDPRMVYFRVQPNQLTLSPLGDVPVFFHTETKCVQCTVCHEVWVNEPPDGHVCYPPIDPKMAWGA